MLPKTTIAEQIAFLDMISNTPCRCGAYDPNGLRCPRCEAVGSINECSEILSEAIREYNWRTGATFPASLPL